MTEENKKKYIPLKSGTRVGDYIINRVLNNGVGGFGILYSARKKNSKNDNESYAVKEFYMSDYHTRADDGCRLISNMDLTKFQDTFDEEQKIYAQLSKAPNIPRIQKSIELNGTKYFVMDYINAPKVSENARDMTKDDLLIMINTVCESLEYCHRKFILHMDISQNNILFTKNRFANSSYSTSCWLIDFGNAIMFTKKEVLDEVEKSTPISYTPGFYDPNLSSQDRISFKPQYDIYSLGKVVEMVVKYSVQMNDQERGFFQPFIEACTAELIEQRPCCVAEALMLLNYQEALVDEGAANIPYEVGTDNLYIDAFGEFVKPDEIRPFRYGYAAVRHGEKWAFMNFMGQMVTDFLYDKVSDVFRGYANVYKMKDNVWHTIRISVDGVYNV